MFKLYFDKVSQKTKPDMNETIKINGRFMSKQFESELYENKQIIENINKGYTLVPANIKRTYDNGKVRGINADAWCSQSLFVVDVDNKQNNTDTFVRKNFQIQSLEDIITKARKYNIGIYCISESFSSCEEHRKYHVFFKSGRVIKNEETAKEIQKNLFLLFGDDNTNNKLVQLFYNKPNSVVYSPLNSFSDEIVLGLELKNEDFFEYNKTLLNEEEFISDEDISSLFEEENKSFHLWSNNFESSNKTGKVIYSKNEFINFFKEQSILDYLKKEGKIDSYVDYKVPFYCVLHDEYNPSATITKFRGQEYYNCFGCNSHLHFVSFYEKYHNCETRNETINRLCDEFNLTIYKYNENEEALYEIIRDNRRKLFTTNEFQVKCPTAFNLLVKYKSFSLLEMLLNLQEMYTKLNVNKDEFKNTFFVSCLYLQNKLYEKDIEFATRKRLPKKKIKKMEVRRISQLISLMAFLKILDKESPNNVQDGFIEKSEEYKKEKNDNLGRFKNEYKYIINYITIGNIEDRYCEIETMAQIFVENKLTIANFTYEMVKNTMGVEYANYVFPQLIGKQDTKAATFRNSSLEREFKRQLTLRGYVLKTELFENVSKEINCSKKVLDDQFKKVFPVLKEKYGVKVNRLTKELREELHIDLETSPTIYYNTEYNKSMGKIEETIEDDDWTPLKDLRVEVQYTQINKTPEEFFDSLVFDTTSEDGLPF